MPSGGKSAVRIVVTKNEKEELRYVWQDALCRHMECFGRTKGEITLLNYIASRTLMYGYYYIDLHVNEFFKCKGTGCIPPLPYSLNYFRRVRSSLKDLGVLFYRSNGGYGRYALNVVGMLRWMIKVGTGAYNLKTMEMSKQVLLRAQGRFEHFGFDASAPIFLTEDGMKIEDAILAGKEMSDSAQKKKATKPMQSAGDLRLRLIHYCEKYGLKYIESQWTVKQKANAKRWVKQMNADPEVPADKMLENVVRLWKSFRKGVLLNDKGTALTLPTHVSFWDFFIHRQRIEPWVRQHIDKKPETKYRRRVSKEVIHL